MTRLHIPVSVRWGDLDALGHVNNATILRLLEEARIRAFFRADDASVDVPPTAVFSTDDIGTSSGEAMLVAKQTVSYLRPVPYHQQPLDVQMWVSKVGGSSMELCYEMCAPAAEDMSSDATVYVRAATLLVLVDTTSGKPTRWKQSMRDVVAPYSDEAIDFSKR